MFCRASVICSFSLLASFSGGRLSRPIAPTIIINAHDRHHDNAELLAMRDEEMFDPAEASQIGFHRIVLLRKSWHRR